VSEKRLVSTRRDRERIRQPAYFIQILADSVSYLGRATPSLVVRNLRREQQAPSITRRDYESEAKTEVLFYNRAERSLSKFLTDDARGPS
jgi:hypothetical protein